MTARLRLLFVACAALAAAGLCLAADAAPVAAARIEVRCSRADPTLAYASDELIRYLGKVDGANVAVDIELGLFADRGINPFPALRDPTLDDAIAIDVTDGRGYIAGSNPRAVLLGVYRYLHELGFRWVRPGAAGEVIPTTIGPKTVAVREQAALRNRIICIEGADSVTNVLDVVDWLPKAGFNGFMMQFRDGYTFFDRWYSHEENPALKHAQPIDRSLAQEFTAQIETEIARRGLLYHQVGHGWHLEAFGVPALGWMPRYDLPSEFRAHVALIGGRRDVPWNIPNLAALSYSDEEVQRRMADSVVAFAKAHPRVDYLHVWLDDMSNNKCECDVCRTKRPADWYFQILNRIDRELTATGLKTRIVFIAYNELLWAPLEEKLQHPGRFTFLYANGRADYTRALDPADNATALPPFRLNRLPTNLNDNRYVVGFLHDWQQRFAGDRLLFEYYDGASTLALARVACEDVRRLPQWGVSGLINCQCLRVWFPNGFGMTALGQALWSGGVDVDAVARDYFSAAYGADATACLEFTGRSEQLTASIARLGAKDPKSAAPDVAALRTLIDGFLPIVERRIAADTADPVPRRLSWRMLRDHVTALRLYADLWDARADGEGQGWQLPQFRLQQFVLQLEADYQPYIQPSEYSRRLGK